MADRPESPPRNSVLLPEAGLRSSQPTETGQIYLWGHGVDVDPVTAPGVRGVKVVEIAAGVDGALVLTEDGTLCVVDASADASQAQLEDEGKRGDGDGEAGGPLRWMCPEALQSIRVVSVACGGGHNVVATDEGRVYAWGRGEEGQLGLGMGLNSEVPQLVTQLEGRVITQLACGHAHTAAITSTGDLYCWGRNFEGQCGTGSHTKTSDLPRACARVQLAPKFVAAFLGVYVSRVACGYKFTSCITGQGEIWTWGEGGCGQLGVGRVSQKDFPQLAAATDVTHNRVGFRDVSCGWGHAVAVSRAGELFVWGFNQFGKQQGETVRRSNGETERRR